MGDVGDGDHEVALALEKRGQPQQHVAGAAGVLEHVAEEDDVVGVGLEVVGEVEPIEVGHDDVRRAIVAAIDAATGSISMPSTSLSFATRCLVT